MSQLNVDVLWPSDRVCDFVPQKFTEPLAEAMHRHFHRPFGQVQLSCNLRVRSDGFVTSNETLEFLEKAALIRRVKLLPQSG